MEKRIDFRTEVLIIGGATAGCFAAIYAKRAGADVLVVDKATSGKSGSSIMACGFWSVYNADWGHNFDETMTYNNRNSSYLNNRNWSETLLRESWGSFEDLVDFGVEFPCKMEEMKDYFTGQLQESTKAAGSGEIHTQFEYVGTKGFGECPTGFRKISPQLRKYAERIGVKFLDRTMVTDIIISDAQCTGAIGFLLDSGETCVMHSKATLLAAGKNTFKGPGMGVCMQTGDSNAMAYRAGTTLTGGEFPDMHSTLALHPYWKSNGGQYATYQLYTRNGGKGTVPWRGFDLGMVSAIHAGQGPILWDLDQATPADIALWKHNEKRRNAFHECGRAGIDIDEGGKYVVAGGAVAGAGAEQSFGIWTTNLSGASTTKGLWSAGDACCTWAWGAIVDGPPPGLMPAGVTGKLAGKEMGEYVKDFDMPKMDEAKVEQLKKTLLMPLERDGGYTADYALQELQHLVMPYYIIHIKNEARMNAALQLLEFQRDHMVPKLYARNPHELRMVHEVKNMICNAELILTASRERRESRGWHYREDYPERNDSEQLSWITMQKDHGKVKVERIPVPQEWCPKADLCDDEQYDKLWFAWDN